MRRAFRKAIGGADGMGGRCLAAGAWARKSARSPREDRQWRKERRAAPTSRVMTSRLPAQAKAARARRRRWSALRRSSSGLAPVAQLDRAPDYESGGQEFESLRARQLLQYVIRYSSELS